MPAGLHDAAGRAGDLDVQSRTDGGGEREGFSAGLLAGDQRQRVPERVREPRPPAHRYPGLTPGALPPGPRVRPAMAATRGPALPWSSVPRGPVGRPRGAAAPVRAAAASS